MKNWTIHEALHWLLNQCREREALIDLTGTGSELAPSGDMIRKAIDYTPREAFESGQKLVRVHGQGNIDAIDRVVVSITELGKKLLQKRERELEGGEGDGNG